MEVSLKATSTLFLNHDKDSTTIKEVIFGLSVSSNLDETKYFDQNDNPTPSGSNAITDCLVQGLIGNIHQSHQSGNRDSAEHLRYIISELERGFVENVTIKKGE